MMLGAERGGVEVGGIGKGFIANDALERRKIIEFQSSRFVIYYKIYFRVHLQPIYAGEVLQRKHNDKDNDKHNDKDKEN